VMDPRRPSGSRPDEGLPGIRNPSPHTMHCRCWEGLAFIHELGNCLELSERPDARFVLIQFPGPLEQRLDPLMVHQTAALVGFPRGESAVLGVAFVLIGRCSRRARSSGGCRAHR